QAFDGPTTGRAWTQADFAVLLGQPGVFVLGDTDGFVLIRVVVDEAEILTLAVRPAARRLGLGLRLIQASAALASGMGATQLLLEVAQDNLPARALYDRAGFEAAGRRPRYYARTDGAAEDALILVLNLPATLP
ncbi:GNAT family N-acetyltransferase, partial [Brevundimonas sp.]|uniref:GNAT family N-acetyltransferase n=1 Tax=Brevundimonas sp. TaxID=1871086 RepID=UPI002ABB7D4D